MAKPLRCVRPDSIFTGWDFSTGGVKCLAFDLQGEVLAEVRLPTDLWHGVHDDQGRLLDSRVCELNLMQLEGQARASVRAIVAELRKRKLLGNWVAGGISATHHTAGRIDQNRVQVRRAICWNDQTLAAYRRRGERRLGGKKRVLELIGGPWADRYSLSHLVKDEDEQYLSPEQWQRTDRILPHGPLAAGYLTGNFGVISVSSAASTGLMDLRRCRWRPEMLEALASPVYRKLARRQLPRIVDQSQPIGALEPHLAAEVGIDPAAAPLIFPTSDDQQAGLVGGGAVEDGQLAIILGNSAVVNSSSARLPQAGNLDVMRLNWGPYLWMRCYNNGAQFIDHVAGPQADWKPADWDRLEREARRCAPGCDGTTVMPFLNPEPSLGVSGADTRWISSDCGAAVSAAASGASGRRDTRTTPTSRGVRRRASLESLAYLIALGVQAHEAAGQKISQITVSGGISRSDLMCEILSSVLGRPLRRLVSDEGPALGAAVTALAALETHLRRQQGIKEPFTVADAVEILVRYREKTVEPNSQWQNVYRAELNKFEQRVRSSARD